MAPLLRSPQRGWYAGTPATLLVLLASQLGDAACTVAAVGRYGPTVEANPLVSAVLPLGVLGLVAWKCALLAVIVAAAALNPGRRRVLLGAGLLTGLVGTASGLAALL